MLTKEEKANVLKEHQKHGKDTGSTEVQIALMTARIRELNEHFKHHSKDHHSRRGLLKLVGRRRRLIEYLKSQSPEKYKQLIEQLGLRK
ncbi:MAG: 30S ribosomal protein S15 [Leptonema sp. (in: Bacteria)]|nr:30S ribosomal protein S15 [Leptonema sp. (in: bacteria)]